MAGACIALDRYVSRKHARVRADGNSVLLTDLDSRNGTKLNGQAVAGDVALPVGTPFTVGRTLLRVTRA